MNETVTCVRCGVAFDPLKDVGQWRCRRHPARTTGAEAGATFACCGVEPGRLWFDKWMAPAAASWLLGCTPCDHVVPGAEKEEEEEDEALRLLFLSPSVRERGPGFGPLRVTEAQMRTAVPDDAERRAIMRDMWETCLVQHAPAFFDALGAASVVAATVLGRETHRLMLHVHAATVHDLYRLHLFQQWRTLAADAPRSRLILVRSLPTPIDAYLTAAAATTGWPERYRLMAHALRYLAGQVDDAQRLYERVQAVARRVMALLEDALPMIPHFVVRISAPRPDPGFVHAYAQRHAQPTATSHGAIGAIERSAQYSHVSFIGFGRRA